MIASGFSDRRYVPARVVRDGLIASGLFGPQLVTWDPETGEFTNVDGPKGFAMWVVAEEVGRLLWAQQIERLGKEGGR